jgi:predicted transposase YbfD/YdcC
LYYISEFRHQNKNFAHPLLDILLLSICAVFHGEIAVSHQLKWIENVAQRPSLKSVVRVKTQHQRQGAYTRYYISSIEKLSAIQAAALAREHWSIENQLHWQLDVSLKKKIAKEIGKTFLHRIYLS